MKKLLMLKVQFYNNFFFVYMSSFILIVCWCNICLILIQIELVLDKAFTFPFPVLLWSQWVTFFNLIRNSYFCVVYASVLLALWHVSILNNICLLFSINSRFMSDFFFNLVGAQFYISLSFVACFYPFFVDYIFLSVISSFKITCHFVSAIAE